MERAKTEEYFLQEAGPLGILKEESCLPPWLFRHQGMNHDLANAHVVNQQDLINTLNHIHFMDGYLLVLLRHPRYDETVIMRAHPEPCTGSSLVCRWSDSNISGLRPEKFDFLSLIIDDGQQMILVPAVPEEIDRETLSVRIPDTSYAVGQRQAKRYDCHGVLVDLVQSGFMARGELMDFSPHGLRVRVRPESFCSFRWFNPDEAVTIHLRRDQQILFSGPCRCIRQKGNASERDIVVVPHERKIRRFKKKEIRNIRQQLVPTPSIVFRHPLLNKNVQLEVHNISTSGFSVYEDPDDRVLISGMIIPELKIEFAGTLKMECSAQVIYSTEEEQGIRYGLAILDMDINSYSCLTHILTKALDPHAQISNEVDMEALWEFFFKAGFIYPKKYRLIQSNRARFKETYEKLYMGNPEISRHFTYQKNGRIYGHISMVRAYKRTWMIHHHSALAMENKRTGFMVLKQIMHYLNDMHRLPSAKMDYVMCYFRPENRFPDRVFGGFARSLKDPQGCSIDLFSYLPHTRLSLGTQLPEGWALKECSALELWELQRFYEYHSGGLLMDALDLKPADQGNENLNREYGKLGMLRESRAYSLTHEGELNAVLIVDRSDLGFNLSELLNGIKILVTNPEGLPWNTLSVAIARLTGEYQMDRVPVLFYPYHYVEKMGVPYEKQYQLWILNVQKGNEYLEYMQKRFRISYK